MKRNVFLLFCLIIPSFLFAGELGSTDEINVYLYNFEPFSFRWTNKFKKVDRVLSFRPSVETELKNFSERKFTLILSLFDSNGEIVFTKSQEIERVEEDKKVCCLVFWLSTQSNIVGDKGSSRDEYSFCWGHRLLHPRHLPTLSYSRFYLFYGCE